MIGQEKKHLSCVLLLVTVVADGCWAAVNNNMRELGLRRNQVNIIFGMQ